MGQHGISIQQALSIASFWEVLQEHPEDCCLLEAVCFEEAGPDAETQTEVLMQDVARWEACYIASASDCDSVSWSLSSTASDADAKSLDGLKDGSKVCGGGNAIRGHQHS
ncbi:hypothetical protein AK812_SmicGene7241 [Symbiodinium microadriaticum]|uniref:Uncharacterized protein n=1 Tax=Symbiodinium microadriaticum TaxID=2951 RepID=A0A1Q9EP25_SYMMI|nr:hypothetical protein AK812_SmicGene7241 [Symbiodinium microadriaticum]